MTSNPTTLLGDREGGTTEERTVRALEMIADQLALIHNGLGAAHLAESPVMAADMPPTGEGSSDPDVICSTETRYTVGSYRYSDLEHAISQAKRARRDGADSTTSSQAPR